MSSGGETGLTVGVAELGAAPALGTATMAGGLLAIIYGSAEVNAGEVLLLQTETADGSGLYQTVARIDNDPTAVQNVVVGFCFLCMGGRRYRFLAGAGAPTVNHYNVATLS